MNTRSLKKHSLKKKSKAGYKNINVHIDRIIFDGIPSSEHTVIIENLKTELQRLFESETTAIHNSPEIYNWDMLPKKISRALARLKITGG